MGYDQQCRKFARNARKNSAMCALCRISLWKKAKCSDRYRTDGPAYRADGDPCRMLSGRCGRPSGRCGRMDGMPIPLRQAGPVGAACRSAAVALAVGAGLGACTPGPASAPSAVAGGARGGGRRPRERDGRDRRRRRGNGRHRADGVHAALEPVRRTAGRPGVRLAPGAAELRRPRRQEDHASRCPWSRRPRRPPSSRASCWSTRAAPGEPGRSLAAAVASRAQPAGGGRRTTSSGFDPRGVGGSSPRAELRPELLRGRAAGLHPGERGRRAGAHRPGQGLRRRRASSGSAGCCRT